MQLTQSQEAARERLHGLIQELAADLGPEPPEGKTGFLLGDWVIVAAWIDPDNGDPYLTRFCSPNLPRYRRDGLLHQGREDWGDA